MTATNAPGLFERWISHEKETGRPMGIILADLNNATGMKYLRNWPAVVASRGFELERCPVAVRRYMMRVVLEAELKKLGIELSPTEIDGLIISLT